MMRRLQAAQFNARSPAAFSGATVMGTSRRLCAAAAAAGLVLSAGSTLLGGAFEVLQQGARASGQAEAFSAQADDASAIWYNPAGLTQLDGTNISAGGYIVVPDEHFKGTLGESSNHLV